MTYEPELTCAGNDDELVCETGKIDTGVVDVVPGEEGVTVLELFAGIGARLEAVLAADIEVKSYVQCERSLQARIVARHRVQRFREEYPGVLSAEAVQGFQSKLPHDVRLISENHRVELGSPVDILRRSQDGNAKACPWLARERG